MCSNDFNSGIVETRVLSNKEISANVFEMIIESKEISNKAKAGQFINLYLNDKSLLLPRPISICEIDQKNQWIKIVFALVGKGTEEISKIKANNRVKVLGPLGNGFSIVDCDESILVGGGVGTPPLLELAKEIVGRKTIYLGYRADPYLVDEFRNYGDVFVATDDGSYGLKGTVIDLMNSTNPSGSIIYSCGPSIMLEEVTKWAIEKNIEAQISLEERMGCGFGACVGCVCKIKADNEEGYTYKKVCKDGPVFDAREVVFK